MSSRNEEILKAIVDGGDPATLQPPQSREEVLLHGILEKVRDSDASIEVSNVEPTNPNTEIWINPEGQENAPKASQILMDDGSTVEEKVDEHTSQLAQKANSASVMRKLISRTIAAGENVAAITWTQDDEGHALALKEAEIKMLVPANGVAVGADGTISARINGATTGYANQSGDNSGSIAVLSFRSVNGLGSCRLHKILSNKFMAQSFYQYSDGTTRASTTRGTLCNFAADSITTIYLLLYGLTYFPDGTVIEIYGRTE